MCAEANQDEPPIGGDPHYANRSVDRALDILEYLGAYRQPLGVSAIATGVGLSNSTTYRLLDVLVRRQFVYKNQMTRQYTLGFEMFHIGATRPAMRMTSMRARPLLVQLAKELDASVFIGARDGTRVELLDRIDAAGGDLGALVKVGIYVDAHATAIGKVLLAYQLADEIDALFQQQPLVRHTANTRTSIARLREDLAGVTAAGSALEEGELLAGVSGIAVPVVNIAGDVYLAIWVICPIAAFTTQWRQRAISRAKRVAGLIAAYRSSEG